MANMDVHFSSEDETWQTPQQLFDDLNSAWHFTLDPCCLPQSAKCDKFFTPEDDGIFQDWTYDTFYMNPPYGRVISRWMEKAKMSFITGATGVCLIPARTDTTYVHKYVFDGATAVCFMKGRVKFVNSHDLSDSDSAPFPTMIVVYDKNFTEDKAMVLGKYGKVIIL